MAQGDPKGSTVTLGLVCPAVTSCDWDHQCDSDPVQVGRGQGGPEAFQGLSRGGRRGGWQGWLCSGGKRDLIAALHCLKSTVEKKKVQLSTVKGQHRQQDGKFQSNMRKKILWRDCLSTGTSCSERLWKCHCYRYILRYVPLKWTWL